MRYICTLKKQGRTLFVMDIEDTEYFCVKCLIEGDEEAFVMLYNKYHRKIYYAALKITGSEDLAQDVTQDVFLKIWETRSRIDPHQNFAAYIHVICRNVIFNLFKKATLEETIKKQMQQFAAITTSDEDDDFYDSYKDLLHKAIGELPPQRRTIYEFCKLKGKTYDHVAHKLNISRSTVQDHIVKANKFIKEYLLKNGSASFAMLYTILDHLSKSL